MNIIKRSVSLLLALALVLSLGMPAYAAGTPRMELEVSSESVEATKTVEVTIKAYDIPKVFAMGFELHANNRIFETVSIDTNWSVSDQLAEKGYIRIATFDMTGDNLVVPEVIATVTLKATEEVDAADIWIEMQEAAYMDETMVDIAAPEKISVQVTPHTHTYEESTVDPTCTTGGYTLHKCVCGDEYKTGNTPATGHSYVDGSCSVCGAPGTVIPEGAGFTDMLTDKGEIVTVTEKDGYYLVEVPYGTTSLLVTYPEALPKVDEFGYVTTSMSGFDGVSQDGYGFTRKDGKIIVGLALEKAPSNGAPTVVRLINLDDQYSKKIAIRMEDGSEETFALTYKLGNGQHFAVLPLPEDCVGYSVTGSPIASDGYTFNVSILDGYEAAENFAVKINGETVATEPGNISVPAVSGDLKVTVEGVSKVQNNTTDVIFNVDLTDAPAGMTGDIMIQDKNYNFIEEPVASGEKSTAAITAGDHEYTKLRVYGVDESLITGWEVNGTVYPSGGKQYVGDLTIWNRGYYLQVEYNGTTPITVDVKPVVEEVHIHEYESVVTPPTCTEGGYTTYTCKAGDDTYVAERTPATGHTNVNGTCSVCGAPLTVIPEGAPFLEIVTSDGKNVTVTDLGDEPNYGMGKLYKVEVPLGTTQVNITYNQEDVLVDNFGYAYTMMVNFPNVSTDGYGQTTKDGKTTVGLQMEKAPANGSPTTIELLNVPYPEDPYELRVVYLTNDDQSVMHAFAFTYELEEGQYFAALPEGVGYTVSGDPIASNGYKFTVSIDEGFEATADFAVKVNGEVVATQPGEVTVASVTEDLYITVEGVAKIADPDTDIILTIDLTGYTGEIDGSIWYSDSDYNNVEVGLNAGKKNTLALTASKNNGFFANIYTVSPLAIGYDINGTVYAFPNSYTTYDLGNGYNLSMQPDGYLSLGTNGTTPGTFVIKPVLGASESVGAAPDFAEPDVIDVTDITIIGADVVSSAWEGDTLNVVLAEDTAANAALKTMWNIHVHNTKGGGQPLFNINGRLQTPTSAEATFDWTNGITLEDGAGTMTVAFEVADVYWDPASQLEFTNKTFTINFTVGGGSTEPEQPEYKSEYGITVLVGENEMDLVADGTEQCGMLQAQKLTVTVPAGTTEVTFKNITDEVLYSQMYVYNGAHNWDEFASDVAEATISLAECGTSFCISDSANAWYHVNIVVEGPEQPESNPITKIELAHPNFVKNEETGEVSMTMVAGASEQIELSFAVENAELEATQVVVWSSSDPETASVEDGKITAHKAGTVTITAKAVNADGIATAAEGDEVLAQFTLTVTEPAEGYTVNMGEDKEVVAKETIQIPVTVTHSDSTVTGYKSYEFTFQYDPTLLTLTTGSSEGEGKDITVVDNNGTVTVRRYGAELKVGEAAITLEFTAKTTCETNVTLTSAKVGTSEDAQDQDIPTAQIVDNVTLITVNGYTVTLPNTLTGEAVVAPNAAYTFEAKDKNYDYTVKATIDGSEIDVTDNGDGTFTIAEGIINGNVTIEVVSQTGKKFEVTLNGASLAHDSGYTEANGKTYAQYMTPYTAKLTKKDHYIYELKVTVNGNTVEYNYNADTGIITVAGNLITGPVVIESGEKESNKYTVEFEGTYASHAKYEGELGVYDGENFSFTLETPEGFVVESYEVSYKMGDAAEYTTLEAADGTYTIANVTGALTIKIEGTSDLKVEVNEYVTLNDKVVFLVTATQTLPEGKTLAYNGTAMYLKNFQVEGKSVQQYAYLVMVDSGTLSVEDATAQITVVEAESTVLDDTFNVNESTALDINDAQLVYDLYNNVYQDITTVGMQKFLRADVNGSKNINVQDAAAVVTAILGAQ